MQEAPVVRATIGEPIADVVARSQYDLSDRVHAGSATDLVVVSEPSQLVYGPDAHAVRLPPGRHVSLVVDAGHVTGATASPHLQALTLDAAMGAADRVARTLRDAGWARTGTAASGERTRAAADADSSGFFRQDLDRWSLGSDRVIVRLRQIADTDGPDGGPGADASAPGASDRRRYLLSVDFENPDASRQFGDLVVRQMKGAPPGQAPP